MGFTRCYKTEVFLHLLNTETTGPISGGLSVAVHRIFYIFEFSCVECVIVFRIHFTNRLSGCWKCFREKKTNVLNDSVRHL